MGPDVFKRLRVNIIISRAKKHAGLQPINKENKKTHIGMARFTCFVIYFKCSIPCRHQFQKHLIGIALSPYVVKTHGGPTNIKSDGVK